MKEDKIKDIEQVKLHITYPLCANTLNSNAAAQYCAELTSVDVEISIPRCCCTPGAERGVAAGRARTSTTPCLSIVLARASDRSTEFSDLWIFSASATRCLSVEFGSFSPFERRGVGSVTLGLGCDSPRGVRGEYIP